MPTRANALVTCTCGLKLGNAARAAASEELQDDEHAIVAGHVPVLVEKHWKADHQLRGHGGLELWDIIVRAATAYAAQDT